MDVTEVGRLGRHWDPRLFHLLFLAYLGLGFHKEGPNFLLIRNPFERIVDKVLQYFNCFFVLVFECKLQGYAVVVLRDLDL